MRVYLFPEFINDLRESGDPNFMRNVLNHTIDNDGCFKDDADDHRYKGIRDCWIRYVSRGSTAYRVIYLRKGDAIYLYRAGRHSIEDRLAEPPEHARCLTCDGTEVTHLITNYDLGLLLKTVEPTFLRNIILSMRFVDHFSITLISPFISPKIIGKFHPFGQMLDRAVEDNTEVSLVTRPPKNGDTSVFKELEERTIFVYFKEDLHSKLYLFDVNPVTLSKFHRGVDKTAIIGSSNLTEMGIGFEGAVNDELCYRLPTEVFYEADTYAKKLIARSVDLNSFIMRSTSKRRI